MILIGQTDPSMKRLKVILTLLGIMLILAVVSSILLDADLSHDNVVKDLEVGEDTGYGSTDAGEISLDPIGLIVVHKAVEKGI